MHCFLSWSEIVRTKKHGNEELQYSSELLFPSVGAQHCHKLGKNGKQADRPLRLSLFVVHAEQFPERDCELPDSNLYSQGQAKELAENNLSRSKLLLANVKARQRKSRSILP